LPKKYRPSLKNSQNENQDKKDRGKQQQNGDSDQQIKHTFDPK
jgi:hypothetical protein